MEEVNTMDFNALRAKFQEEALFQMQPKVKPALPDKPKQVPPPQSPTYHLPAGARPSLLTSINQSLEAKTTVIPRVVFKDDKKESKTPLLQTNSKEKDKSEGKTKAGKDKAAKSSKAKPHDSLSDQKQKKENKDKRFSLVLPRSDTAELVSATPPPKSATMKKGFKGFKKSSKRDSFDIPPDPILDSLSPNIDGAAPLIPVPANFNDAAPQTETSGTSSLPLDIPASPGPADTAEAPPPLLAPLTPGSVGPAEVRLLSIIPDIPEFSPPPAFIPETPFFKVAAPESETQPEIETPALPPSRPTSPVSTPPPSPGTACALPVLSTPTPPSSESDFAYEAEIALKMLPEATPPSPVEAPASIPPSPKLERPISALSALERAEDMSPGKRTPPGDQRILSALEKARKKTSSPATNPTPSNSITPPPEEHTPPQSPTLLLPDLPPIDYEDQAGSAPPPTSAPVNGLDQTAETLPGEALAKEAPAVVQELPVVRPPRKKVFPDRSSLGPPPEKPVRPPSVNLGPFIPAVPLVEDVPSAAVLPVSAEPPKTEPADVQVLDEGVSGSYAPDLQMADVGNGELAGPDSPDGQNLSDRYSNGVSAPEPEAQAVPAPGGDVHPPPAECEAEITNDVYESFDNVHEDNKTASKKRGRTENTKKRKGPPKNPYTEAAQLTKEEKTRTGRFGKSEKKAPPEGPDEKELKKKEKQRLEKEKKEQKEREEREKKELKEKQERERKELKEKQERERKEQKEKEKRENEMKKKFKVTGQEEAMYRAKATVTTKGSKTNLPVKEGDVVSIIRTTNCPKGKWLARDSGNNYGFVAVDHVQLDIREMVELGKKTAINRTSGSNFVDGDVSRTLSAGSFSDDSEEWADDDAASPTHELSPGSHSRTFSMPDMGSKDLSINHQHSYSADGAHVQATNEALQKLTTFFHSSKPEEPAVSRPAVETSPVLEGAVHPAEEKLPKELDFENPEMLILPPPDLYA